MTSAASPSSRRSPSRPCRVSRLCGVGNAGSTQTHGTRTTGPGFALFVSFIGGLDLLPLLPKGGLAVIGSAFRCAHSPPCAWAQTVCRSIQPVRVLFVAPHHMGQGGAARGVAVWQAVSGGRAAGFGWDRWLLFAVAGYSVYWRFLPSSALAIYGC